MSPVVRNILGIIIGVATGVGTVFLTDKISHMVSPPPEGLDYTDKEALVAYIDTLPMSVFLILIIGYGTAAFLAGLVASRIAGKSKKIVGLIAAGLIFVAGTANVIMIPHPLWVAAAMVAIMAIDGYFGAHFGSQRKTPLD
jgi:hypothetical protein